MKFKFFNLFKKKIKEKSKSTYSIETSLYPYILQNENNDDDYWNESAGNGFGDIDNLIKEFDEFDWQELFEDISNWTDYQRELLFRGLTIVDYNKKQFNDSEIFHIEKRFETITLLLQIGVSNYGISIDEEITEYIHMYFPKVNHQSQTIIKSISAIKEWNDSQEWKEISIQNKTISPHSEVIDNAFNKVSIK